MLDLNTLKIGDIVSLDLELSSFRRGTFNYIVEKISNNEIQFISRLGNKFVLNKNNLNFINLNYRTREFEINHSHTTLVNYSDYVKKISDKSDKILEFYSKLNEFKIKDKIKVNHHPSNLPIEGEIIYIENNGDLIIKLDHHINDSSNQIYTRSLNTLLQNIPNELKQFTTSCFMRILPHKDKITKLSNSEKENKMSNPNTHIVDDKAVIMINDAPYNIGDYISITSTKDSKKSINVQIIGLDNTCGKWLTIKSDNENEIDKIKSYTTLLTGSINNFISTNSEKFFNLIDKKYITNKHKNLFGQIYLYPGIDGVSFKIIKNTEPQKIATVFFKNKEYKVGEFYILKNKNTKQETIIQIIGLECENGTFKYLTFKSLIVDQLTNGDYKGILCGTYDDLARIGFARIAFEKMPSEFFKNKDQNVFGQMADYNEDYEIIEKNMKIPDETSSASDLRKETNKYGDTRYYDENDKLHRDNDLPAVEYADGNKCWYQHGKYHRDNDLPAVEYANGDKHWYQHGQFHRDNDLPAIEHANGTKWWYQHGKFIREEKKHIPTIETVRKEIDTYGNIRYYDENNNLHRDNDLPAIEYANGDKSWYQHDNLHRDNDLPAIEYTNGDKWWYQHGKLHRDNDLPAVEYTNGDKYWYQHDKFIREEKKHIPTIETVRKEIDKHGNTRYYDENNKLHRDNDLPAIEYANGNKYWYQHDKRHRDNDLPAIEYANGDKSWYQHDKCHRDNDLPAIECANGDKYWYQHNKLHRLNGPALTYADGNKEYWIDNIKLSEKDFKIKTNKTPSQTQTFKFIKNDYKEYQTTLLTSRVNDLIKNTTLGNGFPYYIGNSFKEKYSLIFKEQFITEYLNCLYTSSKVGISSFLKPETDEYDVYKEVYKQFMISQYYSNSEIIQKQKENVKSIIIERGKYKNLFMEEKYNLFIDEAISLFFQGYFFSNIPIEDKIYQSLIPQCIESVNLYLNKKYNENYIAFNNIVQPVKIFKQNNLSLDLQKDQKYIDVQSELFEQFVILKNQVDAKAKTGKIDMMQANSDAQRTLQSKLDAKLKELYKKEEIITSTKEQISETTKAIYRSATDQGISAFRTILSNSLNDIDKAKSINELLSSDIGEAILRSSLGYTTSFLIKDHHYMNVISEELRISGLSKAGNCIVNLAIEHIKPIITNIISEDIEIVRVEEKQKTTEEITSEQPKQLILEQLN